MKPLLILILSLSFTLNALGQTLSDSLGFTSKAEAKNLMVNGLKEGKWCDYKDSNFVVTTDTAAPYYQLSIYKADKKNGKSWLYRKNEKLLAEGMFSNGKIIGIQKQYYENGILHKYITFKDDEMDGIVKEYDETGKLKTQQAYLDNQETYGYSSIYVQIGCGFVGETSVELDKIKHLVKVKDDTDLVKLLRADDITLEFLCIVAIDNILMKRKISLNEQETKIINDFKTRNDEVYCCEGCTEQYTSTVKKIFNKPTSQIRKDVDSYFKY